MYYTKEEYLLAAELGEVSMIDAKHVCSLLDDAKAYFKATNKKLVIKLDEYDTTCSDGCCSHNGVVTTVAGVDLPCHNQDAFTIVKQLLEHLQINAEIIQSYNGEEF